VVVVMEVEIAVSIKDLAYRRVSANTLLNELSGDKEPQALWIA
jgi:hypothetical protein